MVRIGEQGTDGWICVATYTSFIEGERESVAGMELLGKDKCRK